MNLFSINWWVSMIIQTFIIMCFIMIIKSISSKTNIPVVSNVAASV